MPTQNTAPEAEVEETKAEETADATGFAVYDNTLLKFTSGVVKTKAEANKLKGSGPKGHDLEVRKV